MLWKQQKPSREETISLKQASKVYFYKGERNDGINPIEMFELATVLGVPDVVVACTTRILEILDESNALEVFNLAHQHESDDLKQSSIEIIQKMFPASSIRRKALTALWKQNVRLEQF